MAPATSFSRSVNVLHSDRLASSGALLIPARLIPADLARLAKFAGSRSLVLLTEPVEAYASDIADASRNLGANVLSVASPDIAGSVQRAVAEGHAVLYVPPSVIAPPVANLAIPRRNLEFLCNLHVPIQPIGVDYPHQEILSIDRTTGGAEVVYSVGPLLNPASEGGRYAEVQAALIDASSEAFAARPFLNISLGRALLAGFKQHGATGYVLDGLDGSQTSYAKIFAAAAALAELIKKETSQPRIGIALPPGRGGLVANMAAVLAGKIPVNFNFTAGKDAVESAMKQSGIDRFLTADTFVRKVQSFPWPPTKQLMFLERILPRLQPKIIKWLIALKLLPVPVLAKLLGISSEGGDGEAALLFTSGSSGEPKGVALSHRNIVSNVTQFALRLALPSEDKILGSLPLFHSLGGTVTLWFPIMQGHPLVTYPSPLEVVKLAELVDKHGVALMLSTPTFLRGFLKRVKVEQLASLKLIVTGAEKLPANLEEEFLKKFGKPVMEGYGLTETTPATNFNLPEPSSANSPWPVLPVRRVGSVGQLLPGLAVRITDPITEAEVTVNQSGMIWFKGPNVFKGYLKQPRKTEEVLQNNWFRTGDIGRLDEDGFLFIEGRLSRFSKIGGEMVPHESIEEHITRALRLEGEAERRIAVVGVPDDEKGEALVLLSTVASEAVKQEIIQLRYTLLEQGVPSLWIPRRLVRVEAIPVLASGKLDIKACERLASARGVE
ncbi:MAG: AMP-dependent synthetase and ligase [Verrucomicrobiales bacterium]|nr:AMP-dependent synthetase and ligase [Verrucomicrobiales bacterium]